VVILVEVMKEIMEVMKVLEGIWRGGVDGDEIKGRGEGRR